MVDVARGRALGTDMGGRGAFFCGSQEERHFPFWRGQQKYFAETSTRAHEVHSLKRANAAFFRGEKQLKGGSGRRRTESKYAFEGPARFQLERGKFHHDHWAPEEAPSI